MKFSRIHKAKAYRIFRDFSWPADLPDFARFNLFYGWNGSGKTSLSNIFRHIQRKEPLTEGDVEVAVDGTRVSGADFAAAPLPQVRAFNRDAVDRTIFEVPNQHLPPVYYFGEDSVEKQKAIENLKASLIAISQGQLALEKDRRDASNALDSFAAEEAKSIKNLLTVAGGGPYNNYNAATLRTAIQRSISQPPESSLTEDQRQRCLSAKDGKAMEKLPLPSARFPDVIAFTNRTRVALERSVISSVIHELAANPTIASWVNSGLPLHTGANATELCHFCNQPLPKDRIEQLEAHFNDEFKSFLGEIDLLISEVATAIEFEKTVQLPSETALYPHLRKEYLQANDSMRQQFISVRAYLNMLENALKTKRNEPFQKLAFEPLVTRAIDGKNAAPVELILKAIIEGLGALSGVSGTNTFERLKTIISEHNKYTDRFSSEVEMARKALEADELMRSVPEWNTRNSQLKIIQDQLSEYQRQTKDINEQIGDLERQVLQHRRPAEELNAELAAYLGRDELHFEVEQTGYRITRNGHPATHLSDGERTAVAFLYFLKSLKGTDFDLANSVVVIDDPVSSLDANSIFSAFGFMKERTAEVGQLFVLTHNFTLFRQVRHWFYHLNRGKKPDKRPARFYMLATEYADSIRSASIDNLDPFLHEYESEYHYLFKRVLEEAQKPLGQALETYYAAPNLARRLLEAFLAFRAPEKSGELYQKFEGIPFDTAKKTRILRFLNSYSHFQQITEGEQDPSILSETPTILKDVLVLIKKLDPEHYQRMVDLVSPPQEETVQ